MLPPTLRSPARLLLPAAALLALAAPVAPAAAQTADLAVSAPLRDSAAPAVAGSTGSYAFTVTNHGPDAVDATLKVTPGEGENLLRVDPAAGACTSAVPATCALGTIAPGGTVAVTSRVQFSVGSSSSTHMVLVSGPDGSDPDESNNYAATQTPVAEGEDPGDGPQVTTNGWSRTQASLKVSATVSPGAGGELFFEYGTSKRYGKKTKPRKVSGTEQTTVKATLGGLKINTTYHYRAVLVVGGKRYEGKNVSGRTLGVLKYGPLTLKAVKRTPTKISYTGKLGDGLADAPGACKGTVRLTVYVLDGGELLSRSTKLGQDCTYKITVPFGRSQASKYGPRGKVITQARFSGNKAVKSVGSDPDRP